MQAQKPGNNGSGNRGISQDLFSFIDSKQPDRKKAAQLIFYYRKEAIDASTDSLKSGDRWRAAQLNRTASSYWQLISVIHDKLASSGLPSMCRAEISMACAYETDGDLLQAREHLKKAADYLEKAIPGNDGLRKNSILRIISDIEKKGMNCWPGTSNTLDN